MKVRPRLGAGNRLDRRPAVTWAALEGGELRKKAGLRRDGERGMRIEHDAQQGCAGSRHTDNHRHRRVHRKAGKVYLNPGAGSGTPPAPDSTSTLRAFPFQTRSSSRWAI